MRQPTRSKKKTTTASSLLRQPKAPERPEMTPDDQVISLVPGPEQNTIYAVSRRGRVFKGKDVGVEFVRWVEMKGLPKL